MCQLQSRDRPRQNRNNYHWQKEQQQIGHNTHKRYKRTSSGTSSIGTTFIFNTIGCTAEGKRRC